MIKFFKKKFFSKLIVFNLICSLFLNCCLFNFNRCIAMSVNALNGAILIDSLTGDVLFEQNADFVTPIASTTKIMSTMVVLQNCKNLDEPFVVDSNAIKVEGTSMGLQEGDVVTMRDLCYGMMLASGNDAANAAAVKLCGSIESFVDLMNKTVKQLGLKNTVFKTPSGLDDDFDNSRTAKIKDISKLPRSTARELAILTREAMKNSTFKKICETSKVSLCFGNPPYKRAIFNHNKLLNKMKGVCCGVKTGFTKKAGRCLVSAGRQNGIELIAVVLKDKDDWIDSENLLNFGFSQFNEYELPFNKEKIKMFALNEKDSQIDFELANKSKKFLTKRMLDRIKTKVKASKFLFTPIKKRENVGEIEFYVDDKLIETTDLVSKTAVE